VADVQRVVGDRFAVLENADGWETDPPGTLRSGDEAGFPLVATPRCQRRATEARPHRPGKSGPAIRSNTTARQVVAARLGYSVPVLRRRLWAAELAARDRALR
jgi:hypothetical protein